MNKANWAPLRTTLFSISYAFRPSLLRVATRTLTIQIHHCPPSSSLLPRSPYSNQTADRAGKTDKDVIEIRVPKSGAGDRQVAKIRNELDLGRRSFPVNFISTISNLQTIVIE
jgi:hypothetical protein